MSGAFQGVIMRIGSSAQPSASCSCSAQSRSMLILSGNAIHRPAVQISACMTHTGQRAVLHTCSTPGSSRVAGGQLQRGASACSRQLDRNCGVTAALHADPSTSQGHLSGIQHMVAAPVGDLSEGLETPVQLLYLVTLLGFLVVGAYLVVRQVLVRRELEEAAKVLGERIRTNDASPEDCFELGVILLRKKLYTQATKNLEKASRMWDGEPEELAQVHNALGFAYFNMDRTELATKNYRRAIELQPGYTTAWNNLGDAYEKIKDWDQAMKAYEETLAYSPDNKVARNRVDSLRSKVSMAR